MLRLLTAIKHWAQRSPSRPVQAAWRPARSIAGLDLHRAILAHELWIERLARMLNSAAEVGPVHIPTVCRDDCCELGRWLYASVRLSHGHTPEYLALFASHTEYHRLVGDVCRRHSEGMQTLARRRLETDLREQSNLVRHDLETFFRCHGAGLATPSLANA